jgi:hypothetical protein
MKKNLIIPISITMLTAICLMFTLNRQVSADSVPDFIAAVETGEYEILLADATQKQGPGGMNLNAIYSELKELVKKYKKADSHDSKERIHTRAQELMGQLFDAKVQLERRRVQAAEEKLAKEKQRLAEMQSHKQDLVHNGVQRALQQGELPEWAPKKNESMNN